MKCMAYTRKQWTTSMEPYTHDERREACNEEATHEVKQSWDYTVVADDTNHHLASDGVYASLDHFYTSVFLCEDHANRFNKIHKDFIKPLNNVHLPSRMYIYEAELT